MSRVLFRTLIGFMVTLFSVLSCSSLQTQATSNPNEITVIGEAPIYQGDREIAKQRALKDAKVNAVRKLIGEEINQRVKISNSESLGSSLLSKTDAFVKSYEILSEKTRMLNTQPMLQLTVHCVVEPTKIATEVDALLQDVGNPRILVLIETHEGPKVIAPATPGNTAEAVLIEALRKSGSKVVDASSASRTIPKSLADPDSFDSNFSSLVDKAAQTGAEVLLLGKVETTDQPALREVNGQPLQRPIYSSAATGTYKLVLLWGDGKIIGSGTKDGRGPDVTQEVARDNAVKDWSKAVASGLPEMLRDEWFDVTENNSIILKFTGLDANLATQFRDDLLDFTAAKDINVRTSSVQGSEWEVIYPGKDQQFVDELVYKKDSGFHYLGSGLQMKIDSVSRGTVNLRFVH